MFEQFVQYVLGEVRLIAEAASLWGSRFVAGRNNLGGAEVALFQYH
jgi:hypothetical protein